MLLIAAFFSVQTQLGNTCLHIATRHGRAGIVKLLLAASANIMAINGNLDTPLHIAAALKRTKIARSLLLTKSVNRGSLRKRLVSQTSSSSVSQTLPLSAAQAVLWMRNRQGETPLDVARRRFRDGGNSGSSNMLTLLLDQMTEAERFSHYENGTAKSLAPSSGSGSGGDASGNATDTAVLATPYMSTDLIYSPVPKKNGFKFAFKVSLNASLAFLNQPLTFK